MELQTKILRLQEILEQENTPLKKIIKEAELEIESNWTVKDLYADYSDYLDEIEADTNYKAIIANRKKRIKKLFANDFESFIDIPNCKRVRSTIELMVEDHPKVWKTFPFMYLVPQNVKALVGIVRWAKKINQDADHRNIKLKAIGSRHSFSRVLSIQPNTCYVDLTEVHGYNPYLNYMGRKRQKIRQKLHDETIKHLKPYQTILSCLYDDIELKEEQLINVPGGLTIKELNYILHPDNPKLGKYAHKKRKEIRENAVKLKGLKRLFNMGGGDIQTFSGAFSNGTHGSGGKYSTYHDTIRSILILNAEGKLQRIEPQDAPLTSPEKLAAYNDKQEHDELKEELIVDNDKFYSLLVSMGCFGIIVSAIVEITDQKDNFHESYIYLSGINENNSQQYYCGWDDNFKNNYFDLKKFEDQTERFGEYFRYIMVNPFKTDEHKYHSVILREIIPDDGVGSKRERVRNCVPKMTGNRLSVSVLRHLVRTNSPDPRKRIARNIETAFRHLQDYHRNDIGNLIRTDDVYPVQTLKKEKGGYSDIPYAVWYAGLGEVGDIAPGIEIAVPLEATPSTVDFLINYFNTKKNIENQEIINTMISIRFVRASKGYLASNHKDTPQKSDIKIWCFIELGVVPISGKKKNIKQAIEVFRKLQKEVLARGGRLHWGLSLAFDEEDGKEGFNPFTKERLAATYPKLDKWIDSFKFFNHNGLFDNQFTDQAGFRTNNQNTNTLA